MPGAFLYRLLPGGEGSLISAAGALLGLATDIGGSIRLPSTYCGTFGHMTTPGEDYTDDVFFSFLLYLLQRPVFILCTYQDMHRNHFFLYIVSYSVVER